jgi:predicted regulator of Ras-like GTPase activity (Roadblock/LC7/MglB family)
MTMSSEPLRSALWEILSETIGISGALVATADGILIEAVFEGTASGDGEAESVAALASATVGLGAKFAHLLLLGSAAGTVVQGSNGCVAVQRVGGNAILVLYGRDGPNVARLHLAVRQAVPRIEAVLRRELATGRPQGVWLQKDLPSGRPPASPTPEHDESDVRAR